MHEEANIVDRMRRIRVTTAGNVQMCPMQKALIVQFLRCFPILVRNHLLLFGAILKFGIGVGIGPDGRPSPAAPR